MEPDMPLPPIKISDEVQKAAYDDLAKGAMRKFGDALAVIADRVVNLRFKSAEERALDWQRGAEESENRRRLAAEALDRVPPDRRIFPAPQIAGPIFRDSEFELPETPIWEMWSQLLSRACDRLRVGEAHPAFPGMVKQISVDEGRLLEAIPYTFPPSATISYHGTPYVHEGSWKFHMLPHDIGNRPLTDLSEASLRVCIEHLCHMGLLREVDLGHTTGARRVSFHLTGLGILFLSAVRAPSHSDG